MASSTVSLRNRRLPAPQRLLGGHSEISFGKQV